MIFKQWSDIIGKTVIDTKEYYKETDSTGYVWLVLTTNDGIFIQEFQNEYWESGSVFLMDDAEHYMPQELQDLINQHK